MPKKQILTDLFLILTKRKTVTNVTGQIVYMITNYSSVLSMYRMIHPNKNILKEMKQFNSKHMPAQFQENDL